MKKIVQFSGGKDSQATVLKLAEAGEKFDMVFCDTGWESPDTYKFIEEFHGIVSRLGINLITLKPKWHFRALVMLKKRFPSTMARFCTSELKVKPFIDWVLEQEEDIKIYQGIRWEESKNRSEMPKHDDYFRHYFEKRTDGKKSSYTYRKKDIKKWLEKYSADVERPIIAMTTEQVYEYIEACGFDVNPLYKKGHTRVGCYPCVMSSLGDMSVLVANDPERIAEIERFEVEANSTFFPPDYIPQWACSKVVEYTDKDGVKKTKKVPTIRDVETYVKNTGRTTNIFGGTVCHNPHYKCE